MVAARSIGRPRETFASGIECAERRFSLPSNGSNELQIDERIDFQRKEWRLTRLIWTGWFIFLGLGVIGLFGHGPISEAADSDESGRLHIEYGRFERAKTEDEFRVDLEPVDAQSGEVEIWLSQNYVDEIIIRAVNPEPVKVTAAEGRTLYRFAVSEQAPRLEVTFTIEHTGKSFTRAQVGVVDGPSVRFWQLVYP
jgi:hypothetical protein